MKLPESIVFLVQKVWAGGFLVPHMPQSATEELVKGRRRAEVSVCPSSFNNKPRKVVVEDLWISGYENIVWYLVSWMRLFVMV